MEWPNLNLEEKKLGQSEPSSGGNRPRKSRGDNYAPPPYWLGVTKKTNRIYYFGLNTKTNQTDLVFYDEN